MSRFFILLIKIYQNTLSFDHGPLKFLGIRVCRFDPTCSQYMIDALEKYGTIKGIWLGIKRIFRCHPWTKGGFDPVE